MNKKTVRNLIIAGTVGLTATTVGLTTALTACSTTATQTFSAESIANLKSAILNTITADRLTRSEFNADMFDIVCDNFISNDENLGKLVNEVTFSEQNPNRIIIKLNSSVKYSLPEDFNDKSVVLRENTLSITFSELNFYQVISFNDVSFNVNVLTQLRNSILNSVSVIGAGNFNETELQNSAAIINAINNLKTSDNTNLSNYINTPTYSQETNSINITLKDNIGLYKFNPVSLEGVQVTKNEISLDINSIMQPSPESWFTWGTGENANRITGLSAEGKQQTRIVLPSRATAITNNAFMGTSLVSVDMTLTSITEIPGNSTPNNGTFWGIRSLVSVILPNTLKIIGTRAFNTCTSLKSIIIPDSVTTIADRVFNMCSSLTSIIIPEKVNTINEFNFSDTASLTSIEFLSPSLVFPSNTNNFVNLPSTCVATVKNSTVKTALINAGFTGTINIKNI